MTDGAIVRATAITRSFGPTRVLTGVDISVRAGSVFALLGPNGAGKTTLVRILATLIRPDSGTAEIAGHDVLTRPDRVKRVISLTGQFAAVDDLLTGEENLRMMGRLSHLSRHGSRRRAAELLEQFDLVDARARRVKTYSGGMRRRLDLAASLIARPPVIFLDEPTTGLDPRSRQTMWAAIRALVADGTTIFLTTQYLEEADQLADRISLLDHGRIVAEGTAAELKRRVGSEQAVLTLPDEAGYRRALSLLGAAVLQLDPERHEVAVATDGSAAEVRGLLDRMAGEGVPVARIALRTPSLDDVFLTLTGQPATVEPAPESAR